MTMARERLGMVGGGIGLLYNEYGRLEKTIEFTNLQTRVGDQYWIERGAPVASPPAAICGMQLGTGSTAAAKTGAGAAIVTYIAGSVTAIDAGYPTSTLVGTARRALYRCTFGPGVGTATGICEASLINQPISVNSGAPASNTMARTVLTPFDKAAGSTLYLSWWGDLEAT